MCIVNSLPIITSYILPIVMSDNVRLALYPGPRCTARKRFSLSFDPLIVPLTSLRAVCESELLFSLHLTSNTFSSNPCEPKTQQLFNMPSNWTGFAIDSNIFGMAKLHVPVDSSVSVPPVYIATSHCSSLLSHYCGINKSDISMLHCIAAATEPRLTIGESNVSSASDSDLSALRERYPMLNITRD